ncbi:Uncharacterised protein [Mycobacteroides abscessus subsp. abscessus]|nr:Uncharacterised protein [Mycobacteroides abscessus subsp. abscessus]
MTFLKVRLATPRVVNRPFVLSKMPLLKAPRRLYLSSSSEPAMGVSTAMRMSIAPRLCFCRPMPVSCFARLLLLAAFFSSRGVNVLVMSPAVSGVKGFCRSIWPLPYSVVRTVSY